MQPTTSHDRVDQHGRQLVPMLRNEPVGSVPVVEGHREHVLGHAARHATGSRRRSRGRHCAIRAIRAIELDALVAPVIGAIHFDDPVAAGTRSRGLDSVHVGLGTGVAKTHPLQGRHPLAQQPGEPCLRGLRGVPAGATGGLPLDRPDQCGVGVGVDEGGGVVREVEQPVAVHVVEVVASAAVHVGRIGRKQRAGARIAAGQPRLGTLVQRTRPRRAAAVLPSIRWRSSAKAIMVSLLPSFSHSSFPPLDCGFRRNDGRTT